jgi:Mce-associated membrane protein
VVAPFLALLTLVVLVAVVAVQIDHHTLLTDDRAAADAARNTARTGALAAASAEATNLTTIRYTSATGDVDRIIAGATGRLRAQFARERPQFPAVLARNKSTSEGNVLAAALVSLSGSNDAAQVIVAADAQVSTLTPGGRRQSVLKHYRMVMQLQRVNGRWLVSDVAFAGVPQ